MIFKNWQKTLFCYLPNNASYFEANLEMNMWYIWFGSFTFTKDFFLIYSENNSVFMVSSDRQNKVYFLIIYKVIGKCLQLRVIWPIVQCPCCNSRKCSLFVKQYTSTVKGWCSIYAMENELSLSLVYHRVSYKRVKV